MSTEVKHGPNPSWEHETSPGPFYCLVVGRYTTTEGVGCGGVTGYHFKSERPEKRLAELLVLRTAMRDWWIREWLAHSQDNKWTAEWTWKGEST